jgi:putative tricarboxylic transport membrane protein
VDLMDILNQLLQGFATAATPVNLLWALLGCTLGTAVGVLPGIGPATAVAMLLPITLQVEATASMIFFAGIYYGAMYGGSTTSILLNTPGESGSMVTAMEGNKMAKNGRAGAALATAAIGSFVAGSIATVLVTFGAPIVAKYAVKLGPPEYFMLMLLAFTTVSSVLGKSTLRGLTSLAIGLAMGLVGIDQISGQARYTLGVPELTDGLEVVLIAVGLFAVAEALYAVLFEGRVVETQNRMSKVHYDRPSSGNARGRRGCAPPSSACRSAAFPRVAARSRRSSAMPPRRSCRSTRRNSAPPARSKASPGRRPPTTRLSPQR